MADNLAAPGPGADRRNSGSGGKAILIVIVIILALGGLFALGTIPRLQQNHKIVARAQSIETEVPKVLVTKPKPPFDAALSLPGSTEAIEDAQVGARTTGYLTKRYADIGSHVHAGQVLAEIESPDVDQQLYQANAQVAQSMATVTQSQADVANRQATVAQYQSNVGQAEATLEQARAMVADAEAKLAQLQSAEKTAESQRDQAAATVHIKEAALRQANTQLGLTKVTYDRYALLGKQGFVAAEDVDQNRAAYETAQSAVNSAQADLEGSQKAVEAAISGVQSAKSNILSGEAEVRAAQKNVSAAAAAVRATQSTVRAGQANVKSGQSIVKSNRYAQLANEANSKRMVVLTSFEKVTAPFDGVITARNVDVGSLINAGGGGASGGGSGGSTSATSSTNAGSASTASGSSNAASSSGLFGIARTDVLRILVSVPQAYAPLMHNGIKVQVALNEFPGRTFPGVVSHVAGGLDSVSRTLLTEVHLPNQNGQLLPGMYAQIIFDLPKTSDALRVPATAVTFDSLGTRIAVVTSKHTVHYVDVRQGRDFNTEVEIIDGLKPGDTIVVSPSDDLTEGETIDPVLAKDPPRTAAPGAPVTPAGHDATALPNRPSGGEKTRP
jgi:multidrug efflux pump subunit AcrA (membrane-fusion protein)